nr:hypothetical protein [Tanacetum cinerariifolium]
MRHQDPLKDLRQLAEIVVDVVCYGSPLIIFHPPKTKPVNDSYNFQIKFNQLPTIHVEQEDMRHQDPLKDLRQLAEIVVDVVCYGSVCCSAQSEGRHIKKDKGKKAVSLKDTEEVSTKNGEHVHLTKEQISAHMKIEEKAKAEAARHKCEIRKEELIDLLGPEVLGSGTRIEIRSNDWHPRFGDRGFWKANVVTLIGGSRNGSGGYEEAIPRQSLAND